MGGYAAVILAGGAGRRLGGPGKPMLRVGGRPMLARVLDAVSDADSRIVVGPAGLQVPAGVRRLSEEPAGGGPVAALAAGLAAIEHAVGQPEVAVLAADLPFLTAPAIARLRAALGQSTMDGVMYVDDAGRRQTLCAVWRTVALRRALARRPDHYGAALRDLLADLNVGTVSHVGAGPPPWYDCDSPEDLDGAEGWA